MNATTLIRPATEADFPQLLAVQVASIQSLSQTYRAEEIEAWVHYIEREGPNRYAHLKSAVAESSSGSIQAFVSWSSKEDQGKIDFLFTLPEYQSQAIGSKLLAHAENKLQVKTIQVRATLNARKFYENRGYSFIELTTSRAGFAIALVEKNLEL